ncbi:MAG: sigma-70 family RNA polymerase sigma factor [Candidatus Limiplasma sp.]|nr:sigma-70 family RNA polymerase sigma factor [Candidatus Limiplasma sp.]MEA5144464.1 sigma-70 family RNA polymerase sigma factor [Candidatus Limiplasma sp.]
MADTLLERAQNGDADAFTALCAPYEAMVYRHCLQLLRNPQDAEDAAQEAMVRAYRAMGRFRGGSSIATWLFRIAHNVCLDVLKRPRTRRETASLEALGEAGFDPAAPEDDPEAAYLRQSDRERITQAIGRLPKEQQALLSLRYGQGMSYEELAGALRLGLGTVKSKLNRAKAKLKNLLGEW